ncbi:MAG: fructosamine kinase family protein [Bacteroidota bacterium]
MIPAEILQYIENWLQREVSPACRILSFSVSGGGSINEAFRIETSSGQFFIKYNSAKRYPGMFAAEDRGLAMLAETGCINVPLVLLHHETVNFAFLLLDFIESGSPVKNYWQIFGNGLAALHRKSNALFGLDYDNYIGSLSQCNRQHDSWIEFLVTERFQPQLKMSMDSGILNSRDVRKVTHLCKKLADIIPGEPPSLLHGDLWSGNFMTDEKGNPCILDPAIYYGHREMDIAMTKLFGGFSAEFYQAYQESFPMENGWEKRVEFNQLYPLMVHVNLFGGGYVAQVRQIIGKF